MIAAMDVAGLPVKLDESVPSGTAEVRDGERVVATITGIGTEARREYQGGPMARQAAAEAGVDLAQNIAEAIYFEWNVRNLLVWENVRKPHTRHWREDCPSLRRCKHGRSKLVPKEQLEGGPPLCGLCLYLDECDRARWVMKERERLLAIKPPPLALESG